ncbi:MAG: methyl-accepting chemotaxis protein [Clostridiales bacterium]|nr:methyl-accepting chemotaxis protein [Clostridiales bacterium]
MHKARFFLDDTEAFFDALANGEDVCVITAPAIKTNFPAYKRLFTYLRRLGVKKIYDVSLGADICIWGYLRYIESGNTHPIIAQPCPAIVSYCETHNHRLLRNLSPVHSPMGSLAVYMRNYEGISGKIAALSPCIAKANEFSAIETIDYNVTFEKLFNYIDERGINLPMQPSGFDHYDCALGSVFSTPGGLKENIEFFLGSSLSIDRAEGKHVVYRKLDEYEEQQGMELPDVFDVLNCEEGCNMGPASGNQSSFFHVGRAMDRARKAAREGRDARYFEALYNEYDTKLQLEHFLRRYSPMPVSTLRITEADIEQAYMLMNKDTETKRKFDCGACGSDTCLGMARKLALHVNIPENCLQSSRLKIEKEQQVLEELHRINLDNAEEIERDIDRIKGYVDQLWSNIGAVNSTISGFDKVENIINSISFQINIIAINASIEAARLGEVGKAFSVIAEEVRKLAKVTQETMTENHTVFTGATSTMGDMNAMIKQILDSVTSAYNRIQEINRANAENSDAG